jgi:spore germination cell wall hydrolase CwlJ-like protein
MRILVLSSVALLAAFPSPAQASASEAAAPFVASREPPTFDRALECLTQAVYYEARNQSDSARSRRWC